MALGSRDLGPAWRRVEKRRAAPHHVNSGRDVRGGPADSDVTEAFEACHPV